MPAPDASPSAFPASLAGLVRRLRHLEIRMRHAVESQLQGNFRSVFRGTGLEFDDVRLYQYGDEVRAIDWAVSSKGHGTFVKTYKEEREQQVLIALDVSASQRVGSRTGSQCKLDVGRDLAGLLALSAARQDSALGLLAFSDQKELYLPPAKGIRAAYALIQRLFALEPASRQTALSAGIRLVLSLLRRRSLVVLISDFIDEHYERELTMLARQHDLLVVQLLAPHEAAFPALGIVPLLQDFRRANRFDLTHAVERWGGLKELADLLEYEASSLSPLSRSVAPVSQASAMSTAILCCLEVMWQKCQI